MVVMKHQVAQEAKDQALELGPQALQTEQRGGRKDRCQHRPPHGSPKVGHVQRGSSKSILQAWKGEAQHAARAYPYATPLAPHQSPDTTPAINTGVEISDQVSCRFVDPSAR